MDDAARASEAMPRKRLAARMARPLVQFVETEVAGGLALLIAIVVALAWANSPLGGLYERIWSTELGISVGGFELREDLKHWVNDGLMAIFFFVVGLEIKRELAVGELNSRKKATLPAIAALGGMIVPASLYLALNRTGEASQGWGVPMATDIALALGVLALVSRYVPSQLRVLLLSIAIVDDIGAVLVIAVFYASGIEWAALVVAGALLLVVVGLRSLRVWWVPLYVVVGAGVWLATLQSGVHATVAGVALGLLAPARPLDPKALANAHLPQEERERGMDPQRARVATLRVVASVPVTERLMHILHPWTSFAILPVFALANAGVRLSVGDLGRVLSSPVAAGIIMGLVLGKIVGIFGASWLASHLGAALPEGVGWRSVAGVAAIAGVGFTMSLFIAELAFDQSANLQVAKVAILVASFVAAVLGALWLRLTGQYESD